MNMKRTITLAKQCAVTGMIYQVEVSGLGYNRWKSGIAIHIALPELSDEEREFLLTKTTPREYDKLYPSEPAD